MSKKELTVISTTDPNKTVYIEGVVYRFVAGRCKMPAEKAMKLVQNNLSYLLEDEQKDGSGQVKKQIPFNAELWTKKRKLILDAPSGYANGYGKAAMMLGKGLAQNGIDLYVINSHWATNSERFMTEEFKKAMRKTDYELDSYMVKIFPATEFRTAVTERFVGYTMLEASLIPQSWVDVINNNCERLIVPCEQNKKAFLDSGVKKDIHVVGLGIDPDLFPYVERKPVKKGEDFVFGTMGTLTYRKGPDILKKAFKIAFDGMNNVRLYFKTRDVRGFTFGYYLTPAEIRGEDPQIVVNTEVYTPKQLNTEFFNKIDAFVFPTRGEGFGLPPLEAMATGCPVIATNWSGPAEYMRHNYAYPIDDYELVNVPYKAGKDNDGKIVNTDYRGYSQELYREGMQWAEVDPEKLAETMFKVYENHDKAVKKAKAGAQYVRNNWTAKHTAKKLIDYLDQKV